MIPRSLLRGESMRRENYAETGGALMEMAPRNSLVLSGIFRQIYLWDSKMEGGSNTVFETGTINVEMNLTGCFTIEWLYLTKSTPLKAWQCIGRSSESWWSSWLIGQSPSIATFTASAWWWCGTRLCPRKTEKQVRSKNDMVFFPSIANLGNERQK